MACLMPGGNGQLRSQPRLFVDAFRIKGRRELRTTLFNLSAGDADDDDEGSRKRKGDFNLFESDVGVKSENSDASMRAWHGTASRRVQLEALCTEVRPRRWCHGELPVGGVEHRELLFVVGFAVKKKTESVWDRRNRNNDKDGTEDSREDETSISPLVLREGTRPFPADPTLEARWEWKNLSLRRKCFCPDDFR